MRRRSWISVLLSVLLSILLPGLGFYVLRAYAKGNEYFFSVVLLLIVSVIILFVLPIIGFAIILALLLLVAVLWLASIIHTIVRCFAAPDPKAKRLDHFIRDFFRELPPKKRKNVQIGVGSFVVVIVLSIALYRLFLVPPVIPVLTQEDAIPLDWEVGRILTHPNLQDNYDVLSVIYAKDQFVAVGSRGLIMTSPDGEEWALQKSGVRDSLYQIIEVEDHLIAVGPTGMILQSEDGVDWTPRQINIENRLERIAYGNGYYIANGGRSRLLESTDGLNWNEVSSVYSMKALYYHDNHFFVRGLAGYGKTKEIGGEWRTDWGKLEESHFANLRNRNRSIDLYSDMTYGNGVYLGTALEQHTTPPIGVIMRSYDGEKWKKSMRIEGFRPYGITYGAGEVVTVGSGFVLRSQDGEHWQLFTHTGGSFRDVTYGRGRFVAVGSQGLIMYGE